MIGKAFGFGFGRTRKVVKHRNLQLGLLRLSPLNIRDYGSHVSDGFEKPWCRTDEDKPRRNSSSFRTHPHGALDTDSKKGGVLQKSPIEPGSTV